MTRGHDPADSAGTPWQARELSPSGFEADDGTASPALLAALASAPDDTALMEAVRAARLLVPVVAAPTEVDTTGEHPVETSVDMAAVTLVAPDGRRALPVFSGLDSLRAWDPDARPVPFHRCCGPILCRRRQQTDRRLRQAPRQSSGRPRKATTDPRPTRPRRAPPRCCGRD